MFGIGIVQYLNGSFYFCIKMESSLCGFSLCFFLIQELLKGKYCFSKEMLLKQKGFFYPYSSNLNIKILVTAMFVLIS